MKYHRKMRVYEAVEVISRKKEGQGKDGDCREVCGEWVRIGTARV